MNFTELSSSVRPEIIRATQAMGYTEMTEIQQKAIPLMLAGHVFNDTATTEIYTLSLHDALPIWRSSGQHRQWDIPR